MSNFEKAVLATIKQTVGYSVTEECAKEYAHELMKAAIKQLRDDGNIVEILNPID